MVQDPTPWFVSETTSEGANGEQGGQSQALQGFVDGYYNTQAIARPRSGSIASARHAGQLPTPGTDKAGSPISAPHHCFGAAAAH